MGTIVASILPFPPLQQTIQIFDRSFDAEITTLICQAFDKACQELHDRGQPDSVKEIIAKRIVEIAGRGERDPNNMYKAALTSLGVRKNTAGRFIT
jgi:hypothetical protein